MRRVLSCQDQPRGSRNPRPIYSRDLGLLQSKFLFEIIPKIETDQYKQIAHLSSSSIHSLHSTPDQWVDLVFRGHANCYSVLQIKYPPRILRLLHSLP